MRDKYDEEYWANKRLSNCCAEPVFGEYDNNPDLPPTGICSGCGDHAVFYTDKEFEEIDRALNPEGKAYGE